MREYLSKTFKNVSIIALFLFGSLTLSAANLAIDKSHSEVAFSIKHLMISNVKGEFTDYDANIEYNLKTKKLTKLDAYIVTKSIDTGIEKRDKHLRSADFFEVDKFPKITFKMTSHEEDTLIGDLTIHGVTKRVKLDIENNGSIKDLKGKTRIGFTIEGKINRKDFALTWNKALEVGGVVVGDRVKITIELELIVL